jgi:alkyl sulfatase BDS1-like metallo-beta-lactamase superfamily hydrolase
MNTFSDTREAGEIMKTVVARMDTKKLTNVKLVYSYQFTDLDWGFTVSVDTGSVQMSEGISPASETTIETTSDVFDKVMTGKMSVTTAHFTNQAKLHGSVANVWKLQSVVPVLSDAYRRVQEARLAAPRS